MSQRYYSIGDYVKIKNEKILKSNKKIEEKKHLYYTLGEKIFE